MTDESTQLVVNSKSFHFHRDAHSNKIVDNLKPKSETTNRAHHRKRPRRSYDKYNRELSALLKTLRRTKNRFPNERDNLKNRLSRQFTKTRTLIPRFWGWLLALVGMVQALSFITCFHFGKLSIPRETILSTCLELHPPELPNCYLRNWTEILSSGNSYTVSRNLL